MTATFRQAIDETLAIVHSVSVARGVIESYEATKGAAPTDNDFWIEVQVRHDSGGQASLAGDRGRKRRWNRAGVLWIKLYGPIGSGLGPIYDVGQDYVRALQGKSTDSCVWFRNVRLSEVGPSGVWYQVNVLANFTYDEVV